MRSRDSGTAFNWAESRAEKAKPRSSEAAEHSGEAARLRRTRRLRSRFQSLRDWPREPRGRTATAQRASAKHEAGRAGSMHKSRHGALAPTD